MPRVLGPPTSARQCFGAAPGRPRPPWRGLPAAGGHGDRQARAHTSIQGRGRFRHAASTPPHAVPGNGEPLVDDRFADLPIAAHLGTIAARLAASPRALRPDEEQAGGAEAAPVLILEAAPGAGKTTAVPLIMAESLPHGVTMVIEPRRLAARAAARRMASLLGERPGGRVGFRVRGQAAISRATVVEVVTPGVALRALARAAAAATDGRGAAGRVLGRYAAIMVDEVHERGVEADACLALLASHSPLRTARPDLRVVAASATLGGGLAERVAALLDGGGGGTDHSSILTLPDGRAFPVRTVYAGPPASPSDRDLASAVVAGLKSGWALQPAADALVFLTGAREIRAVTAALAAAPGLPPSLAVLPLHGSLPAADQDAALRPPAAPTTRVILATPVAESSLTVPGVRLVIDAGLARTPTSDAASGMDRLVTTPISQASADQRRGRAGRTAPGVCVRLWTEASNARRPVAGRPAIERADLAGAALVLASAGVGNGLDGLAWLDPPPAEAVARARGLLARLGAVEGGEGVGGPLTLTPGGAAMARLGAHPRLGRALLVAADLGVPALGSVLAGLVSAGRDVFPRPSAGRAAHALGADLAPRVLALAGQGPGAGILDGRAARTVLDDSLVLHGQLRRVLAAAGEDGDAEAGPASSDDDEEGEGEEDGGEAASTASGLPRYGKGPAGRAALASDAASQLTASPPSLLGALVAAAYPDRVAARRSRANRGRDAAFDVGGGASASVSARLPDPSDPLQSAPLLAVATMASSAPGKSPVILAAAALDPTSPPARSIPGLVVVRERATWTPGPDRRLACVRATCIGDAVAAEEAVDAGQVPVAELEKAASALAASAGLAGVGAPPAVLATRARAAWAASSSPSWPDLSERHLARTLPAWLPGVVRARTAADLAALPWAEGLARLLPAQQWADVEAAAPPAWAVRDGVALSIDYSDPAGPVAVVPLDLAFEAGLAAGVPPAPAVGVRLVLPGGGPAVADAPSLEALWKDWPRVRAALRKRPGGKGQEWPEVAPGGGGGGRSGGKVGTAAGRTGKKKR